MNSPSNLPYRPSAEEGKAFIAEVYDLADINKNKKLGRHIPNQIQQEFEAEFGIDWMRR